MAAVLLALASAVLFGGTAVALALAFQRNTDAEAGAVVTGFVALGVTGTLALFSLPWQGAVWPFFLAGLLAPGGSQFLYVRAVREVGPSRAAVVVGAAPLVAVTIALVAFHEPLSAPLLVGAILIVLGGLALAGERDRPSHARAIGLVLAFGAAAFFATRDNVVRHLAQDTEVDAQLGAAATILSGTAVMVGYLLAARGRRVVMDVRRAFAPFAPAGVLWGLSYADALRGLLPRPRHRRQPARRNGGPVRHPARRDRPRPPRARRASRDRRRRADRDAEASSSA